MKIIDEATEHEIKDPDLTAGYISNPFMWAPPEAYDTIDNVTKFALADEDYEEVQLYHRYTDEELAEREAAEAEAQKQELIDALPDAIAELSELVSQILGGE